MGLKPIEKLGDLLVKKGLIDQMQLRSALGHQRRWGGKLGKCLVDLGFLREEQMLKFLAENFHMKAVDLTRSHIAPQTFKMVPESVARKYEVVPVVVRDVGGKKSIVLAMSDPSDLQAVDEIQFLTNAKVEPVLATDSAIMRVLEHYGSYSPEMVSPRFGERHGEPAPQAAPPAAAPKAPPAPPPAEAKEDEAALPEIEPEPIITLDEGIDIEPDEEIEIIQGEVTMLRTRAEPKRPPQPQPGGPEPTPRPQAQQERFEPSEFELESEKPHPPAARSEAPPRPRREDKFDFGTERPPQPPPVRDERADESAYADREAKPEDVPPVPQPEEDVLEIKADEKMEIEMGPPSVADVQFAAHESERKEAMDFIDMPEGEEESLSPDMILADAHEFIPDYMPEKASEQGVTEEYSSSKVHPKLLQQQEVARVEGLARRKEPVKAPLSVEAPAWQTPEPEAPDILGAPEAEQPEPQPREMEFEEPVFEEPPVPEPQEMEPEAPKPEEPPAPEPQEMEPETPGFEETPPDKPKELHFEPPDLGGAPPIQEQEMRFEPPSFETQPTGTPHEMKIETPEWDQPPQEMQQETEAGPPGWEAPPPIPRGQGLETPELGAPTQEQPREMRIETAEEEEFPPLFQTEEPPQELPFQDEVPWETSGPPAVDHEMPPIPEEPPSLFDSEPPHIDFLRPEGEREVVLPSEEGYEFEPKVSLPFEAPITPGFEGDLVDRPDTPDFSAMPEKEMPDTGLSEKEMFFNVEPREEDIREEGVESGDFERIPAVRGEEEALDTIARRLREIEEIDTDFLDSRTVKAQMEKILELETEVRKKEFQFDDLLNLMMKKELGEITSEIFMNELTTLRLRIEQQKRKKRNR